MWGVGRSRTCTKHFQGGHFPWSQTGTEALKIQGDAVEGSVAQCCGSRERRMLEGSLQRQQTPSTVPDSGAALSGGAEWNSHLGGTAQCLGILGACTFLWRDAQIFHSAVESHRVLLVLVCWVWVSLRSWRKSFRGAGKGCSGHLADI